MNDQVIVLVEDNSGDEVLTLRALKQNKIMNPVVVLRDGAEPLDYLFGTGVHANPNPPVPQLVLLDLNLPKIGGLDVLRRIRADESTRLLPVVILTSSREERDVASGYDLGANSYVVKPVDFSHFSEAVRQLGLYWLIVNQAPPRTRP
jgi:two-component system response regulator